MSRNSFTDRKRLFFRGPVLLAGIAMVCTGISLVMICEIVIQQHEAYLAGQIVEQLNWLNMVGRSNDWNPQGTLEQYVQFGAKHRALGESGEFVLAVQEGDGIRLLVQKDLPNGETRLMGADAAGSEPMQKALAGNKGAMLGFDHRGHKVIAAFAPVPNFNWGVIAKSDVSEVLLPFLKSTAIIAFTILVVIIGGLRLVVQLGRPLIRELEQSQECVALAIRGNKHGM